MPGSLPPLAGRDMGARDVAFVRAVVREVAACALIGDEEALSVGLLAYWLAARRFKADAGVSWASFAGRRVHGAVLDEARRCDHLSRRQREAVRRDGVTASAMAPMLWSTPVTSRTSGTRSGWTAGGGTPLTLADVVADPRRHADAELVATVDAALEAVKRIHPRAAIALRLHYMRGWTLEDVGAFLDVGAPRVSQLLKLGRDLLRDRDLLSLDLLEAA